MSRLQTYLIPLGWFLSGTVAGALLLAVAVWNQLLTLSIELTLSDLLQLLVALFLALYIPLAIEGFRDRRKYSRDILVDQVQAFMVLMREVNGLLLDCARTNNTDESHRMRIKAAFITANLKSQSIEQRVRQDCSDSTEILNEMQGAHKKYFATVTSGSLYGSNGKADWQLWRQQELPFAELENACIDLVRFLRDVGR
jgi:hypothetical protein